MPPRPPKRKLDDGEGGHGYKEKKRKRREAPRPTGRRQIHIQDRPSDHWKRDDEALTASEVEEVISGGNLEYIFAEAQRCYSWEDVICTADLSRWVRGVDNAVFELAFSDGTFWIARVRLGDDDDEELEAEMLSEMATMNMVRARTSIPVPAVFAYNPHKMNPFGYPYMLMSALPGRKLEDQFASSVPEALRPEVARQLARYVWELSSITFDQVGRVWCGRGLDEPPRIIPFPAQDEEIGPFNSASAYFFGTRREVNRKIRDQHLAGEDWPEWSASCELFTRAIPMLVCPQFRRGPFPLYHHDLHYNNILADDNYNITGVLDWTGVGTAPVERFTTYADLMTYPLLSDAENRPIANFRGLFIAAYRRLEEGPIATNERGRTTPPTLSHLFESKLPEAIYRWNTGVPRTLARARRSGLLLVRLLYGSETTLESYEARRRKGFGRQFRLELSTPPV